MFPLMHIPSILFKYRRLIGYGLAVLAILAMLLTYRHSLIQDGVKLGREQVRKEWANSITVANREISMRDAAYAALQGERDKAKAAYIALLNRPPAAPRTLIREVPTDAPAATCPRLSPDFRVRYNAAADAADH